VLCPHDLQSCDFIIGNDTFVRVDAIIAKIESNVGMKTGLYWDSAIYNMSVIRDPYSTRYFVSENDSPKPSGSDLITFLLNLKMLIPGC
jgi:hypothetical protein